MEGNWAVLLHALLTVGTLFLLVLGIGGLLYRLIIEHYRYKHQVLRRRTELEAYLHSVAHGQAVAGGWEGISVQDDLDDNFVADWKHARETPEAPELENHLPLVKLALSAPVWSSVAYTRVLAGDVSYCRDGTRTEVTGFAALEIGKLLAGQIPKLIAGVHVPEGSAVAQARDFLRQYLSGAKYIAHNSQADLNVLLPWLSLQKGAAESALMQAQEDTHALARQRLRSPQPKDWKLTTLTATLGLPCDLKPHTAIGDAVRTAELAVLLYTGRRVHIRPLQSELQKEMAQGSKDLDQPRAQLPWVKYFHVSYGSEHLAVEEGEDDDAI